MAQIKLTEVLKSQNSTGYPIAMDPYNRVVSSTTVDLRPKLTRIFNDSSKLLISKYSFNVDLARLWNQAPPEVTASVTLSTAKAAILAYVKSFPV